MDGWMDGCCTYGMIFPERRLNLDITFSAATALPVPAIKKP
jgi:hypothetical protein